MQKWEKIYSLCKQRGFLFRSADIYAGLRGCFDYGPLGTELKRNIQNEWWRRIVHSRRDVVALDTPILGSKEVWQASGHIQEFHDVMVDCLLTKSRFRTDHGRPLQVDTEVKRQRNGRDLIAIPIYSSTPAQAKQLAKEIQERLAPGCLVECKHKTVHVFAEQVQPDRIVLATTDNAEVPLVIPYRGYVHVDSNSFFLSEPRQFNLMFKTTLGPVDTVDAVIQKTAEIVQNAPTPLEPSALRSLIDQFLASNSANSSQSVYLRPETAQGVFTNFLNCQRSQNMKLPFGIAQTGKAFRNEIRPDQVLLRMPEFEQMELEWFCKANDRAQWLRYWVDQRLDWWQSYAANPGRFRLRPHASDELAHYAQACTDIEYEMDENSWVELEGVADRGSFDLDRHSQASGTALHCLEETGQGKMGPVMPVVIESSAGLSRACWTYLNDAYTEECKVVNGKTTTRVYLRLHPRLAPIKVAVLPLLTREQGIVDMCDQLLDQFCEQGIVARLDAAGRSIGRRYARQDEIGTPWCITVDVDSLTDRKVTIRDRDTMEQCRVPIDGCLTKIQSLLASSLPMTTKTVKQEAVSLA